MCQCGGSMEIVDVSHDGWMLECTECGRNGVFRKGRRSIFYEGIQAVDQFISGGQENGAEKHSPGE